MKMNYKQLEKLLALYGLSLKIKGDNVYFTSLEDGLPLQPCFHKMDTRIFKPIVSDAKYLLNGLAFYVVGNSAYYKLNITYYKSGDYFIVGCISKTVMKEPFVYDQYSFNCEEFNYRLGYLEFDVKESTYKTHIGRDGLETWFGETISETTYTARKNSGFKVAQGERYADIWYKEDEKTGKMVPCYNDDDFLDMNIDEAIELIYNSNMFKKTMDLLCPKATKCYKNLKGKALEFKK